MKNRNETSKPPIGITPRHIHESIRTQEILAAMVRMHAACKQIPIEWIRELEDLCS